jgi:hypothetical protein
MSAYIAPWNGKTYYFHFRKTARGGSITYFSFKPEGSVDLPPGYIIVKGPTGLPIAKKDKTTGV